MIIVVYKILNKLSSANVKNALNAICIHQREVKPLTKYSYVICNGWLIVDIECMVSAEWLLF